MAHRGLLRILYGSLSVVILVMGLRPLVYVLMTTPDANGYLAIDYRLYMDATDRWLASGVFYQPYQLAGP